MGTMLQGVLQQQHDPADPSKLVEYPTSLGRCWVGAGCWLAGGSVGGLDLEIASGRI